MKSLLITYPAYDMICFQVFYWVPYWPAICVLFICLDWSEFAVSDISEFYSFILWSQWAISIELDIGIYNM